MLWYKPQLYHRIIRTCKKARTITHRDYASHRTIVGIGALEDNVSCVNIKHRKAVAYGSCYVLGAEWDEARHPVDVDLVLAEVGLWAAEHAQAHEGVGVPHHNHTVQ